MIESTATSQSTSNLTQLQLLEGSLSFVKQNKYALAAWQLPGENKIQLIIDCSGAIEASNSSIEDLQEGFLFSPFSKEKKKTFIKADIKVNTTHPEKSEFKSAELKEAYLDHIKNSRPNYPGNKLKKQITTINQSEDNYLQLVQNSINSIKNGEFIKVVPSRSKEVALTEDFNVCEQFLKLADRYHNSFVSLVFTPATNIWLGATPEILIHTKGNTFKTVALAGTQAYNPETDLSEIAWTQKEIEEQALVSRYIINCFKKIRLREFDEVGPKTVIAGNLIHLKTVFTVNMEATNFPQLGSVMLDLLHPTSAICGMPLESSYEFINKHEGYDRKFFSGYLGPVNSADETALFVNLRCMEIVGEKGILYAGAGVTESSKPSKEWLETEMKMNTLLNVFNS